MDRDFEIVKVESCYFPPWKVFVTVKCLQDIHSNYITIIGKRVIFAKKGDYIRFKISKDRCPILGRFVDIDYLLPDAINQNAIGNYWDYE